MGVEVHANIIDNCCTMASQRDISHRGLREEGTDWAHPALRTRPRLLLPPPAPALRNLLTLATLTAFTAFVYYASQLGDAGTSFVIPAGTLVATYAAIISFRTMLKSAKKRKIRKTFGQYLSPGVIALIDKDPERYIRPAVSRKNSA